MPLLEFHPGALAFAVYHPSQPALLLHSRYASHGPLPPLYNFFRMQCGLSCMQCCGLDKRERAEQRGSECVVKKGQLV